MGLRSWVEVINHVSKAIDVYPRCKLVNSTRELDLPNLAATTIRPGDAMDFAKDPLESINTCYPSYFSVCPSVFHFPTVRHPSSINKFSLFFIAVTRYQLVQDSRQLLPGHLIVCQATHASRASCVRKSSSLSTQLLIRLKKTSAYRQSKSHAGIFRDNGCRPGNNPDQPLGRMRHFRSRAARSVRNPPAPRAGLHAGKLPSSECGGDALVKPTLGAAEALPLVTEYIIQSSPMASDYGFARETGLNQTAGHPG